MTFDPAHFPVLSDRCVGRTLIAAHTAQDGRVLSATLGEAGIETVVCRDVEHLSREIEHGANAIVVADECLSRRGLGLLAQALADAPTWSEMPVIVMVRRGHGLQESFRVLHELGEAARITLLERPVATLTLTSAVRAALASRRHQYLVRDAIDKLTTTEAALKESEARLRAAVDGSDIGVFEYDPVADSLEATKRSWQIVAENEAVETSNFESWMALVHSEDRDRVEKAWRMALVPGGEGRYQADYRIVGSDGSVRWVSSSAQTGLVADKGGASAKRLVGTVQDVTQERVRQERLEELTERLEQLVASRTEKLEKRRAQLRRLANQLVLTEQRERARLSKMLHDHLQQILAAAKIQVDLVRDGLRQPELEPELDSAEELLEQAVEASRSLAMELSPPALQNGSLKAALEWQAQWMKSHHKLHTELRVEESLPDVPNEAKIVLFEAVRELLFNTVKHANVDRCEVQLYGDDGELCLSVRDAGKGFDPAILEAAEGLGLFSIRERLEAMGARMHVEAAVGKGATFLLVVPGSKPHQEDSPSKREKAIPVRSGEPKRKIRLLVVDDHPIVRDGLVAMIRKRSDMEVVGEGADGEEAVELAGLLSPDVIVMDINMPKMDGLQATREIKRRHPAIRIVGLSIQREDAAAREMARAGASAFLAKGGQSDVLFDTLRKVVSS